MKRFLIIILSAFLLTSTVQAQTVKVKAIENFSSTNPKQTFQVQTIKYEQFFGDFFLEPGTVISGYIVKVREPKRGQRDSCLEFMPKTISYAGKTTNINKTEIIGIIKGYEPIDKKDIAIKTGTTVADFFLKGLIDVAEFVQGAVQNKYGGRIKSGAVNVYKNSFFTLIEVGNQLNVKSGDILVLKIKKYSN